MPYARRRTYRRKPKRSNRRRLQTYSTSKRDQLKRNLDAIKKGAAYGVKAASWYKKLKNTPKSSSSESAEEKYIQNTSDFRYSRARYGRFQRAAKKARKLIKTEQHVDLFGIRNYLAWGTGYGANYLQSLQTGLVGTQMECPVHLFDLSGVPQPRTDGTDEDRRLYFPATQYVLNFTSDTDAGIVDWKYYSNDATQVSALGAIDASTITQSGRRNFYPLNTTSGGWVPGANTVNEDFGVGSKSFLESFNAKILAYSCRGHPTKFQIQLVQLHEDVQPYQISERATAFWQAVAKEYSYNPIEKQNSHLLKKYMKIMKSVTFVLDSPVKNNDSDLDSRVRQIDFKGFLNRKVNYKWGYNTDTIGMTNLDTFENAIAGDSQIQFHPHPNARVYLMIKAMCPFNGPEGGVGALATAASYDISLDVKHRNLTGM